MARKALVVKQQRLIELKKKYDSILKDSKNLSWEERYKLFKKYKGKTKYYNRCQVCGRVHSYNRELWICRVCLRMYAREGKLMGIKKASW